MNRCLLPILVATMLCSATGWSQKKLLTPADTVVKIALLDHSALRKEFKAFRIARDKLSNEIKAEKKSFDEQISNLNKQTKLLLQRDSLRGGANRQSLSSQAGKKRSALTAAFRESQDKRVRTLRTLMQDYEKKIREAIEEVVREGGFTDVKPLINDAETPPGENITQRVLQKLNK